jgi:putative colanic acid biosynthesis acetyltransferase WcaF
LPLLKPPIKVGSGVWIAREAFIGPGVTVHDNAVVGARAVVMKDVPPATVVAGNPAQVVKERAMKDSAEPGRGA